MEKESFETEDKGTLDDYDSEGYLPCICGSRNQSIGGPSDDHLSITCLDCGRLVFGTHLTLIPNWNERLEY